MIRPFSEAERSLAPFELTIALAEASPAATRSVDVDGMRRAVADISTRARAPWAEYWKSPVVANSEYAFLFEDYLFNTRQTEGLYRALAGARELYARQLDGEPPYAVPPEGWMWLLPRDRPRDRRELCLAPLASYPDDHRPQICVPILNPTAGP